jgi:hypothetical protein
LLTESDSDISTSVARTTCFFGVASAC